MSTFREIGYMIYDELKLSSDDSYFNIDHVYFLMNKWRSFILKQKYSDVKKEIPEQNFQVICLDIDYNNDCITGDEVKSIQKLPDITNLGGTDLISDITPKNDFFKGIEFSMVSRDRMKYVGHNKWLQRVIYFSLGPDRHLYLKSGDIDYTYLQGVSLTSIFDNPEDAVALSCDKEDLNECDIYENEYPLEDGLIPLLIECVVKELTPAVYKPEDEDNNATDDLSNLTSGR